MDLVEKEYYIDSSRAFFKFLIQSRQWTGFGERELNQWIDNFTQIENGEYIACMLLNECIGYSEKDIVSMLKGEITSILIKEKILPKQLSTKFSTMKPEIEYEIRENLENTLFIPLTVNDAPGESGDAIVRLLTQQVGNILNRQFPFEIDKDCNYDRIIILDDCIGSGQQFKEFWEEKEIKGGTKLRVWCQEKSIKVYYVVIVGFIDTIKELRTLYNDVEFVCVEELKEHHKIIEKLKKNEVFSSSEEELKEHLDECNIRLLGFNDMEFAVFIHNNIPDWSLPVFYKARENWIPLLRRKNSND